MRVQNPSSGTLKINYDDTVPGFVGMIIGPQGETYWDITDDIIIYAKCATGTITVNVEELS